jgi:hypothetical protein
MRSFTKVTPAMWTSPQFQELSDEGRLLLLYYMTGPHQTMCGVSRVPDGYVSDDLRWPVDKCSEARQKLMTDQLILVDDETHEVFVSGWWRDNLPENPSHSTGVKRAIAAIMSDSLRNAARESLERAEKDRSASRLSTAANPMEIMRQRALARSTAGG